MQITTMMTTRNRCIQFMRYGGHHVTELPRAVQKSHNGRKVKCDWRMSTRFQSRVWRAVTCALVG